MPARIVSCVRSRVCAAGRPARVPRDGGGEAGAQGSLDGCSAAAGAVGTRRRPICDYRARMQRKICAAITVERRRHARVMRDAGARAHAKNVMVTPIRSRPSRGFESVDRGLQRM
jgi:hypothetical protein